MNAKRILAVGSVALDSVTTPFGSVTRALGGSASYFGASARFFTDVSLVGVVGRDFPSKHLKLLKRLGVDTQAVQTMPGKTFFWKGRYNYDLNNAQTLKTELNVFASFKPVVPAPLRRCKTVFLANIDPEIQYSVLAQVRTPQLTACDTMNFWIENKKKSLVSLLKRVQIFLCNDSEARELTGEYNLIQAARWVLSRGPRLFVIKKGEHGVLCFSSDFITAMPAFLLENVFDPTGAGDTFAGGFIGYLTKAGRLNRQSVCRAVAYGSVLASYNVESFSLNRLAALRVQDVERRYKQFKEMTRF